MAGQLTDIPQMQAVFAESLLKTCAHDYQPAQIEAWRSKALNNQQRWLKLINQYETLVIAKAHALFGFASLSSEGLIDMFFLHSQIQGMGWAGKLFMELEKLARQSGLSELHSHVSVTALGFFKKMGFDEMKEQSVLIDGVELRNYRMSKQLSNEQIT